jgi:hypothetical protein
MKTRHIVAMLVGASLVALAIVSCTPAGISIDQRVSDFQSDLNTSDRASAYQDFDPNDTLYSSLKSGSYFTPVFPVSSSYSLSVIDESNPSGGVIVQVTGVASGLGYPSPYFLKLTMTENSDKVWLIQTLSVGGTSSGAWTLEYY